MKTLRYFFFVALATVLMAADCSNKDSEFYNDVFVSVPDLVVVETSDIPEDHSIYVGATVPRLLTVANMANPLDIRKTTGDAARLFFSYELEKETAGVWDYVEITDAHIAVSKGQAESGSFVLASAVYNTLTEAYESRVGLQNLPTGNYRLSFGYNSNSNNIVEMRSESINNNLFLNLNSPTSDLDASGYYFFTVN